MKIIKEGCLSQSIFLAVIGTLLLTSGMTAYSLSNNASSSPQLQQTENQTKISKSLSSAAISQQTQQVKDEVNGKSEANGKDSKNEDGDLFQSVRNLANLGFYKEAQDKLKAVIKDKPQVPIPEDLKYLSGNSDRIGGKIPIWRYILLQIDPWIIPVIGLLAAVISIYIIVRFLLDLHKPRLDVQNFVTETAESIGEGLAAMIEEQIHNINPQKLRQSPQIVVGSTEEIKIPDDISSLAPPLKFFSLLIDILPLIPWKAYTLSGYLQPQLANGVGITLQLKKQKGDLVANCTFWQQDYEPEINVKQENSQKTEAYYCLAEPVAIWTLFQLPETKYSLKNSLEINNWQSYAFFRSGVYWRQLDDKEKARIMFLKAIQVEPSNYFALCNLGILDTEAGEYDRAIERLQRAIKLVVEKKGDNISQCPLWYKAQYQLAATYLYKKLLLTKEAPEKSTEAEQLAKEAVKELIEKIKLELKEPSENTSKIQKNNKPDQNKEIKFQDFFEAFTPMALILYFDICALPEWEQDNKITEDRDFLRFKLGSKRCEIDKQTISSRTHYNLACYYSGREKYDEALQHLEYALEPKDKILWSWAHKDPSLKKIRDRQKKKFDDLSEKYGFSNHTDGNSSYNTSTSVVTVVPQKNNPCKDVNLQLLSDLPKDRSQSS